jgi:ketosteroid isomerase-like protein
VSSHSATGLAIEIGARQTETAFAVVAREAKMNVAELTNAEVARPNLTTTEARNIEVVCSYFDACNSGELNDLLATLTPDVVHYFLPARFPPIRGADHLARYWRKYKLALDPIWSVDHAIAQGNEVVSEWSCIWTPRGTQTRLLLRGSEWYVMRDGKIAEIRAYFMHDDQGSTGLIGFPYGDRGYLAL